MFSSCEREKGWHVGRWVKKTQSAATCFITREESVNVWRRVITCGQGTIFDHKSVYALQHWFSRIGIDFMINSGEVFESFIKIKDCWAHMC